MDDKEINEYNLLYKRVNDLEAQVNKMEATCKIQHPVNLSERSTVCEIKIKNVKELFEKFEQNATNELNKLKGDMTQCHDNLVEDIDSKIAKFDQRINNLENSIHEMNGKINTMNITLTDITNAKVKSKNTLSSLWVTIVGTVISSIVLGIITYFFTVHNMYQSHQNYENSINNNGRTHIQKVDK